MDDHPAAQDDRVLPSGERRGPLHELLIGYRSHLAPKIEGCVALWTNGKQALVRARAGWDKGVVTAFSAFPEHGVPLFLTESREYALPKRRLSAQDVFDHACLLAEDRRLKELCVLFYRKNRSVLRRHRAIEAVLRGEDVPEWFGRGES